MVVSLFDWTLRTSNYRCQSIGFISDSRRNVTICAGRSGIIFNTTAERVKITLKNGHGDFLLKYKISGCPDPDMPSGKSWLRREGDQAILGCNATKHNWKLTCDPGNGRWRGEKAYSCPEGIRSMTLPILNVFSPLCKVHLSTQNEVATKTNVEALITGMKCHYHKVTV